MYAETCLHSNLFTIKMTYAGLLHKLPEEIRSLFRQKENISKKLIDIKWSNEFNSIWLRENIMPKYSRIRLHDPAATTTSATLNYRKYLVDREINVKKKKKRERT